MIQDCGKILKINRNITESRDENFQVYDLIGNSYRWSSQIGIVLDVDPDLTTNCWFLDEEPNTTEPVYTIAAISSEYTVGGIVNIKRPAIRLKTKRRLSFLLDKPERSTHGYMAFGH